MKARSPVVFLEVALTVRCLGCMVVELKDLRDSPSTSEGSNTQSKRSAVNDNTPAKITRVVLRPNGESFWADLCLLNQKTGKKWTDQEALEVEARILVRSPLNVVVFGSPLHPRSPQRRRYV